MALGVVLLLIAGGIWTYTRCTDPERVFWATISQSLRSSAVTVQAEQTGSGTTIHETVGYSLGANNIAQSHTVLSKAGTTVVSETIGTPTQDYTRYASIDTVQKGAGGKPLDFSKVVGVWAKGDGGTGSQIFPQAVLGTGLPIGGMVVPIADLSTNLRNKLVTQIHADNVYQTTFEKAKSARVRGRLQYTYDVKISPVAYARLMKSFAGSLGLHGLDQLNPTSFQGQPALNVKITIDVASHHVARIVLVEGNYTQSYTSYDVPMNASIPAKTITTKELQGRLSQIQ